MGAYKISVTSEDCEGHKIIRFTTGDISLGFDAADTLIDDWERMLRAARGIDVTADPVKIFRSDCLNNTFLYFSNGQLTLEIDQSGDVGSVSMQVELPSSITVDLLTQVINELAKYQVRPASE
jgi:hypothetical protein